VAGQHRGVQQALQEQGGQEYSANMHPESKFVIPADSVPHSHQAIVTNNRVLDKQPLTKDIVMMSIIAVWPPCAPARNSLIIYVVLLLSRGFHYSRQRWGSNAVC